MTIPPKVKTPSLAGVLGGTLWAILIASAFTAPPPGNWNLEWNDEFDGSSIDSNNWSWGSLPWSSARHHNEEYASYIMPEDSYVSNGSLWLRSREASGDEFGGFPYSEGMVYSNGKFHYTYGYLEIRARFPLGQGLWPAFWTLSDGWPPEFDIAEYFGSDDRMHMGLAYGTCCPADWDSSNFYGEGVDSWHTWGLEWGPGYAVWYKDGTVKKTLYGSNVPDSPMYIILNSGVRHDADSSTPFPNHFEVDYVRLYQLDGSDPIAGNHRAIVNRASGRVMDAFGNSNGANVIIYSDYATANQRWHITSLGGGEYSIRSAQNGHRSLDVWNWGTENGTNIALYDHWDGDTQRFYIEDVGDGYHRITPVISTDQALDAFGTENESNVGTWSYWGGSNQQWSIE